MMPKSGKESRLSEAFVTKYQEFYHLAIELLGPEKANDFIRWLSANGRFVPGRIQELACEHLLLKAKAQKKVLRSKRDDGYDERVQHAAQATCDAADQFIRLSKIWGQLTDSTHSQGKTGELAQIALGDEYPWQSLTSRQNSGF